MYECPWPEKEISEKITTAVYWECPIKLDILLDYSSQVYDAFVEYLEKGWNSLWTSYKIATNGRNHSIVYSMMTFDFNDFFLSTCKIWNIYWFQTISLPSVCPYHSIANRLVQSRDYLFSPITVQLRHTFSANHESASIADNDVQSAEAVDLLMEGWSIWRIWLMSSVVRWQTSYRED